VIWRDPGPMASLNLLYGAGGKGHAPNPRGTFSFLREDPQATSPKFEVVDAQGVAGIRMTLTAPGCPAAQSLPVEVSDKVKKVPGVSDAKVEVVWEPGWTKDRMSEAAKLQLGLW